MIEGFHTHIALTSATFSRTCTFTHCMNLQMDVAFLASPATGMSRDANNGRVVGLYVRASAFKTANRGDGVKSPSIREFLFGSIPIQTKIFRFDFPKRIDFRLIRFSTSLPYRLRLLCCQMSTLLRHHESLSQLYKDQSINIT